MKAFVKSVENNLIEGQFKNLICIYYWMGKCILCVIDCWLWYLVEFFLFVKFLFKEWKYLSKSFTYKVKYFINFSHFIRMDKPIIVFIKLCFNLFCIWSRLDWFILTHSSLHSCPCFQGRSLEALDQQCFIL